MSLPARDFAISSPKKALAEGQPKSLTSSLHFPLTMLEFFRRHRGPFLISLTVAVILAFAVWGGVSGMGGPSNDPSNIRTQKAFSVYGTDYTHEDVARYGKMQRLAYSLGMYEFAFAIPGLAQRQGSLNGGMNSTDFVANLLVLRQQALAHGIAVSDAEARAEFEKLQPFQKDGKYDPTQAENYLNNIRANGFQVTDVLDLLKDKITLDALRDVVGSNYVASPLEIDKAYASQQQTINASTITFSLEELKKKAVVKDDEIKKYYDEKKDTFKTPEKRAAQVVTFERPKADPARTAEDNTKIEQQWEKAVGDFYTAFNKPGSDIAKLVAEANSKIEAVYKATPAKPAEAPAKPAEAKKPEAPAALPAPVAKIEKLDLFEQATPAAAIKDEPEILKELFRSSLAVNTASDPIDSTKGYSFLSVTKVEVPRQQEQKEVADKIKDTLLTQKAQEALANAAKDARTAFADAIKAGKKLEDVAKEKSWKLESLGEFTSSAPPAGKPNAAELAQAASKTKVNGVSEPVTVDGNQVLVVVTKKVLFKSDSAVAQKDSQRSSLNSRGKEAMFKAWFGKMRDDAKVETYVAPELGA
jgi:hypothetical protein